MEVIFREVDYCMKISREEYRILYKRMKGLYDLKRNRGSRYYLSCIIQLIRGCNYRDKLIKRMLEDSIKGCDVNSGWSKHLYALIYEIEFEDMPLEIADCMYGEVAKWRISCGIR